MWKEEALDNYEDEDLLDEPDSFAISYFNSHDQQCEEASVREWITKQLKD